MKNLSNNPFYLFVILLTISLFILPLNYESNDDVFLELTYNGFFTNSLETENLFSHYFLGTIMLFFYSKFQNINFFGLLNILTLYFSIVFIIYLACKNYIKTNSIIFALFSIGVFSICIINFNYSITAFFAGFTGLIGVFTVFNSRNIKLILISSILIFLSMIIRPQFFLMALFLNIPIVFHQLKKQRSDVLLIFLALIFTYFSLQFANSFFYNNNKDWKQLYTNYQIEKNIIDNPCVNNYYVKSHFNRLQWSENDLKMYREFYFDYPRSLTFEKVKYLDNVIPHDALDIKEFVPLFLEFIPWYFWLMIVSVWIISFINGEKKQFIFNLLYFILILSVLEYLSGSKYIFKERFIMPIVFSYCLNCLLFLKNGNKVEKYLSFFPILFLIMHLGVKVRKIKDSDNDFRVLQQKMISLNNEKSIFFDYYLSYPYSNFKSWKSNIDQLNGLKFIPTGWIMNTPAGIKYLKHLGFHSMNTAISNENTMHLVPFQNLDNYKTTLSTYFIEHYNRKIYFQNIQDIVTQNNHWVVIKLILQ